MRSGDGGGCCTTSLLPAAAPPTPAHPGVRIRHPVAGTFPPVPRILPLQPNNNKAPSPSRPVTGEGGPCPSG